MPPYASTSILSRMCGLARPARMAEYSPSSESMARSDASSSSSIISSIFSFSIIVFASVSVFFIVSLRTLLRGNERADLLAAHGAKNGIFFVQTERERGNAVFHAHGSRRGIDDFQPLIHDVVISKFIVLLCGGVGFRIGIVDAVYVFRH